RDIPKLMAWRRRSKPLNPMSKVRRRTQERRRRLIAEMQRFGPVLCVRCARLADDLDEILNRSQGGDPASAENCQPLCRECHTWKTEHPAQARAEGWAKGRVI